MILRSRRYLPHLEFPNSTYFITFRLNDSVPTSILKKWKDERKQIMQNAIRQKRNFTKYEKQRLDYVFSKKVQDYLDRSYGQCWLEDPQIAEMVVNALRHFDNKTYNLHAWCIMPNHVHVVITVISNADKSVSDLIPILHSWKSFTAHLANKFLLRSGPFWQQEYYDHRIRNDEEFAHYVEYTLLNPVLANLCTGWRDWKWAGCSKEIESLLQGWHGGRDARTTL